MEYFTVGYLAKKLHVQPSSVRRWARNGEIPYTLKEGGRGSRPTIVFTQEDIDEYLKRIEEKRA